MLCINKYPQDYVKRSKSRVDQQLGAYRGTATNQPKSKDTKLDGGLRSFEPVFFNKMVLVLDSYFTHRSRTIEGKDGNAANEVRVLCSSILENNSVLRADKSIKLKPDSSILKLKPGDPIALKEAEFSCLAKAFFAEIESKFKE